MNGVESLTKAERRKMKQYELSSKDDFKYYLYQLICRLHKIQKRMKYWLDDLHQYIVVEQRKRTLVVPKHIIVPFDEYENRLEPLASSETHLLNTIGDMQACSLSYYKFRDMIRRRQKKNQDVFGLSDLSEDLWATLKAFNEARNFANHEPESLITAEEYLEQKKVLAEVCYNPIQIVNYATCTLEFVIDLYESYKHMYDGSLTVMDQMKSDYECLLGQSVQIIDVFVPESKGIEHLQSVKVASDVQK